MAKAAKRKPAKKAAKKGAKKARKVKPAASAPASEGA